MADGTGALAARPLARPMRLEASRPRQEAAAQELKAAEPILCRICWGEETQQDPLLQPCSCTGSMRHVHRSCLQRWQRSLLFQRGPVAARGCDVCMQPWRGLCEPEGSVRPWFRHACLVEMCCAFKLVFNPIARLDGLRFAGGRGVVYVDAGMPTAMAVYSTTAFWLLAGDAFHPPLHYPRMLSWGSQLLLAAGWLPGMPPGLLRWASLYARAYGSMLLLRTVLFPLIYSAFKSVASTCARACTAARQVVQEGLFGLAHLGTVCLRKLLGVAVAWGLQVSPLLVASLGTALLKRSRARQ